MRDQEAIERLRSTVAGDECARQAIVMAFARDLAALLAAYDRAVQERNEAIARLSVSR